jgi:vacuolar-type H+-ATPase subunit B/Vma2
MSQFKAGGQGNSAQQWKEKADELAEALLEVTAERDDYRETLDHIAELAAPDQDERLGRIEDMLETLFVHFGLQRERPVTVISEQES